MAKAASKKAPTKTEILNSIAAATGLSKKDVGAVKSTINPNFDPSQPNGRG